MIDFGLTVLFFIWHYFLAVLKPIAAGDVTPISELRKFISKYM